MPRFILKQWRETFEEVIIEADNFFEADKLGEQYPDIDCPVEAVNEVESTLRYEVEAIETTKWTVIFDDPRNGYAAESQPFETEGVDSVKEAKEKAMEWLCKLNDSPNYNYVFDLPVVIAEWKANIQPQVDTLILTRDLSNGAWLTLIEAYQPK